MDRRSVLRRTAALTPFALAGCTGDGDGATSTPTDGTPSAPGTPSIDSTAIETIDTSCAGGDASVARLAADAKRHELEVTGTVEAPNPCHLAEFGALELDDGTLSVMVGVAPDGQDGCMECVGAVEYRGTIRLTAGGETEVVVFHGARQDASEVLRETLEL